LLCAVLANVYGRLPKTHGGVCSSKAALNYSSLLVFSVPYEFPRLFAALVERHLPLALAFNLAAAKFGSSGSNAVGLACAGLALGNGGRHVLEDPGPPLRPPALLAVAPLFGALGSPPAPRVRTAVSLSFSGVRAGDEADTLRTLRTGLKRVLSEVKKTSPLFLLPYPVATPAPAAGSPLQTEAQWRAKNAAAAAAAPPLGAPIPLFERTHEVIQLYLNGALTDAGVGLYPRLVRLNLWCAIMTRAPACEVLACAQSRAALRALALAAAIGSCTMGKWSVLLASPTSSWLVEIPVMRFLIGLAAGRTAADAARPLAADVPPTAACTSAINTLLRSADADAMVHAVPVKGGAKWTALVGELREYVASTEKKANAASASSRYRAKRRNPPQAGEEGGAGEEEGGVAGEGEVG
jgi:hypothetical protein